MNRKQDVQTPRVASTVNRFEVLRKPFNRNEYEEETVSSQGASVGKENKSRFVWRKSQQIGLKENCVESVVENKTKGTLVMGDSMIKHVGLKSATVNIYRGIRAEQLCKKVEEINPGEVGDPEIIVLHVGTNNVIGSQNADEVMAEVYELIRCTKKKFPKAKVVVNSIIIRRDVNFSYLRQINENLRWACDALKAVFVDLNRFIDESCLGKDGLHLNRKGSFILGNIIKNVSNICKNQGNDRQG